MEWGVEEIVRDRLGPHAAELHIERRVFEMIHDSVDALLDFQERNLGPLAAARMALGGRFENLHRELCALAGELNLATDGTARLEVPYLLAVASAPGSS
jgi:hypothetical protein